MTDHSRPHLYSATGSGGGAGAGVGASARDTSRYPGQAAHPSASSASYQHTSYNTPRSRDSAMFDDAPDDNEPSSSSAFLQHPSHGQGQYQYSSSPRVGQGQYQGPTIATAERAYNANMASSLRGKRAPAPAALDLSPPSARERERERVRQESFVVAGTGMEAAPTGLAYGAGPSQGSQNQFSGLGLGMPGHAPGEEKRVMTDSAAQRRASRPLPHPPGRRDSSLSTLSFPQPYRQESYDSSLTYNGVGMGSGTSGGGGGMAVPLPAVGLGQGPRLGPGANIGPGVGQGSGGAARRVSQATVGGSERPSLDSYYFTSDPSNPSEDDHEQSSASHGTAREYEETTSPGFTPVTPNVPDPFTLDRAGLIGTGELATPRWATSNLHPNLRTPAAPPLGLSHSPNVGTPHTAIGMADRGWTTGNDGIGLGVGVRDGHMSTSAETSFGTGMNGLARSPALSHSTSTSNFTLQMSASPNAPGSASASAASKARRERALSHVDSPPKVPGKSEYRGSTGPSASTSSSIYRPRDASLPRLTHAGSFQDFSFDTGMEAAINAAFDSPGAPPSALASSTADITPREYRQQLAGQGNVPQPLKLTDDLASVPPAQYSPNSARARTAARKAERERRISGLQEAAHVVPERSTSKMTPPHSATSIDSLYAARQRDREREKERDSRKTPPYSQSTHLREISAPALGAGGKGKHSPSTSHHHDILRHFAPKDFSHLPPSPSSASINQFLRNSNSTGNFGSSALGGVGIGVGSPSSKTPPTTSTSHVSYFPNTASNGPPTPSHSQAGGNPNASMTSYKSGITRSDSQRSNRLKSGSKSWEGREVDRDTAEAMRKLDGLGSTPKGKAGSRGSKLSGGSGLGSAGHTSRPESPTRERNGSGGVGKGLAPPQTQVQGQGQSERQGSASSPLSRWTDLADETRALNIGMENGGRMGQGNAYGRVNGLEGPVMPAARRESPSTASFEGTPTSRDSTSITTPSSSSARPDLKQRRASVGSDFSTAGSDPGPHNSTGSCEKVGELSVPPVPPLPKGYASMRYGLSNAANSMPPPSTAPIQPAYQPLVDNSYGQIPTPVTASVAVTTPNIHGSPATSSSPASTTDQRPRQMNKKWSFSSAISLRLNRGDSGNANTSISSPPQAYTQASPDLSRTDYDDSSYIWNQTMPGDFSGMSYAPPHQQNQHAGSDTSSATASRLENRSATSITPVGLAPPAPASSNGSASGPSSKPPPTNKRLTPSGIPFFRRTSSSSTQPKQPTPPASSIEQFSGGSKSSLPPVSKIPTSASTNTRKSMLGMHFPSMLRSSGSKRHLSQQAPVASAQEVQDYVNIGADGKGASSGWGRTRGKTMSISGPLEPKAMMPNNNAEPRFNTLRPKASDSSLRSGHSYIHESGSQTLRASKSGLPPISGSPAVKPQASSGSLRTNENQPPQAPTPTRIPRLSSRNPSPAISGSVNSMGPPPAPVAHTMSHSRSVQLGGSKTIASTSSLADFSRPNASASSGVSEFGAMGLPKAHIRNTSNDPQRSRLLAPMSTRNDPKPRTFAKPAEPAQRIERPANIPPSRRTMPLPPSAAAMTISAQAKRVTRDVKPGLSRHSSKDGDSGRNSTEDGPAAIKPSKSLHAKLNVPSAGGHAHVTSVSGNGTRIPSSSSVGAPSVGYRKVSLATTHSETPSPAEDEETLADAEMAAYVSRRKARVAAGTGRKDDLKDIEGFPEDIAPVQPISQRAYISQNLARMTDYERKEALDHDLIYFVPRVPIIREPQKGGATYNYGFDDERGDYLVVEGDHLCYRYEVMGVLGKGSFGQVLECRDHKTGKSVAVKIIRNKKRFHAQAMVETKILGQLVEWDPEDKHYMVCMTDHFNFRSHLCIVTELLSINLYELIKANQFAGFSTTLIRRFTMQMLSSLQLMRSHRIVHCDLKPENILLRHPCKSGIKVIDFGSSCHETEKVYTYIQSRFYRSPEVILGMNYAMAIDMWSLGCILAELYTGVPIFPGENEHEQLACIMEVLGVPDPTIVNKAQRKKLFFDTSGAPRPFVNAKGKRRRPGSKTLAQALKCKDELFIDFISKCLTWDPDRRLKPQPAMRHPWILAGRRRYAPPPPTSSHRLAERASISGSTGSGSTPLASARVVSSGLKSGSTSGSTSTAVPSALGPSSATNSAGDKKQYVISPPTPLVAKNGYGQVPSPAPRLGYGAAPRVVQALNTRGSFIGTSKVSYD